MKYYRSLTHSHVMKHMYPLVSIFRGCSLTVRQMTCSMISYQYYRNIRISSIDIIVFVTVIFQSRI